MSGILTPGYLRWDGTKYVLDHDIEIVGPPGSAGPAGVAGPAGPPGPNGVASGDLLGNYPGPISVVGLTGISGIVNFGSTITNPTISQATTGSTLGQPLTIRGQAGATIGGAVVLQSGTGTTAGIIQFVVGSVPAGFIDANSTWRLGPAASSTIASGPNGAAPVAGTDFIYGYNASGSMWSEYFTSAADHRSAVGVYNSAAPGTAVNGLSIQGVGSTYSVAAYRSNGVIEQNGLATSGLILAKALGDGSSRGITGRIWQTGAWCIGDNAINDTSAEAQTVAGALINLSSANFGSINGSTPFINLFGGTLSGLTTTTSQTTIYNAANQNNTFGNLVLQGNLGVSLVAQNVVAASVNTTKLINTVGRTHRVRTTTTTPVTVVTTDEILSIGTVSSVSTTIAAGSNGASLPQGTINVAATTGFATTGAIYVTTSFGPQLVTYTGTTGTTFTGCSGGAGLMTTGNAITSLFAVNLPTSPNTGDLYSVKDANGSCGTTNFFISGNGINIDGQTGIVLSTNYTQATFVYNGTTWISSLANNLIPNGFSSVINVPSSGVQTVVGFDQLLLCDPTSGGVTVNAPPNPLAGLRFTVKDATAQSTPLKPITVNGNGRSLEDPGSPGFYTSTVNMTATARAVTWAYDPTRNRYTVV